MMPLLLRIWKATLSRLESSQILPTALFSQPTSQPPSLKDEVLELIGPWRNCSEKPPFTTGELIVMMLVIGRIPMRLEDVEIQILSTFNYYNQQAVRAQARRRCVATTRDHDDDDDDDEETEILPDFYDAVEEFEHPSCIGNLKAYSKGCVDLEYQTFGITTGAARLYLRNRLEPARKGVFNFMQLPAELREKIYKMLLIYPKSGLALAKMQQGNGVWKRQRLGVPTLDDTENTNYALACKQIEDNGIAVGSSTDILSILRVSKQIRDEALPIFYGHNSFHFDSLPLLVRALRVITEETAQQIYDLRIYVGCEGSDRLEDLLQEVNRAVVKLSPRKLTLIVGGDDFWRFCHGEGYAWDWKTSPAPAAVHKLDGSNGLDGLVTLAKSVEHLRIFGDGFLRPWLEEKTVKSGMRQIHEAGSSAATVGTVIAPGS